jgi:Ran GTPase-activating protein (RanGAP) involved in mRNA processing and transport
MGALSTLILSQNGIIQREVGTVLADMLKANTVLTNLDISDCAYCTAGPDGAGFARELAVGIRGNGALTSLHVGNNDIPEKEMRQIMAIAMHMGSMKILCEIPFKDKTLTELDVSGKNLGSEGALVVAEYLDDNRALSVLSLKNNGLGTKEAGKVLGGMLKENSVLKELDISENMYYSSGWKIDPEFAEELAAGIKDNEALSKLDVRNNYINAEGKSALKKAAGVGVFWSRCVQLYFLSFYSSL